MELSLYADLIKQDPFPKKASLAGISIVKKGIYIWHLKEFSKFFRDYIKN